MEQSTTVEQEDCPDCDEYLCESHYEIEARRWASYFGVSYPPKPGDKEKLEDFGRAHGYLRYDD